MKKRFTKKQLDVMKVLWERRYIEYQYRTGMSPLTDCEPFY